jgi:hypothetical protein
VSGRLFAATGLLNRGWAMKKILLAVAVGTVALVAVGCQAPDWVRFDVHAYRDQKPGVVTFRGYSGVRADPLLAEERARESVANDFAVWVLHDEQLENFYSPDVRANRAFAAMESLIKQFIADTALESMKDRSLLLDNYSKRRRDRYETTYEEWALYGFPRSEIVAILGRARESLKLHILDKDLGSGKEPTRKLTDQTAAFFDHLAKLVGPPVSRGAR